MNSEGIGLGLTIVSKIIYLAGGDIQVFSDGEGQGSLFCFSMDFEIERPKETDEEEK